MKPKFWEYDQGWFFFFELFIVINKVESEGEEESSVTDVSEHDTEEEREKGDGKQSGVHFSVPGGSVCVNYELGLGEMILGKVRWSRWFWKE